MSEYFDKLRQVSGSLGPADLPQSTEIQHVLGAVVAVLDKAGVTIADDLLPEAAPLIDAGNAAAAPTVEADASRALQELVARGEALLAHLEPHAAAPTPEPGPVAPNSPVTEAVGPVPPAPVAETNPVPEPGPSEEVEPA